MVGLGKAALAKGYKKVMVIAEDYAFPYSQVQGFMAEYCRLGGKVPEKAWVPLGGKDYSSVIARIPKDVDALLVVLGGADAVNFLNQYEAAGGDKPMVGGSITVSQDVLNYKRQAARLAGRHALGRPATRTRTTAPEWKAFVADYKKNFPVSAGGFPSPACSRIVYYINMKAALDGARRGQGRPVRRPGEVPRGALEDDAEDADRRRQARRQPAGDRHDLHHRGGQGRRRATYNKVVRKVDNVDQMLGMTKEEFKMGSRDEPDCP